MKISSRQWKLIRILLSRRTDNSLSRYVTKTTETKEKKPEMWTRNGKVMKMNKETEEKEGNMSKVLF